MVSWDQVRFLRALVPFLLILGIAAGALSDLRSATPSTYATEGVIATGAVLKVVDAVSLRPRVVLGRHAARLQTRSKHTVFALPVSNAGLAPPSLHGRVLKQDSGFRRTAAVPSAALRGPPSSL